MSAPDIHIAKLRLRKGSKQVLDRISARIPSGAVSVLIGANGSGKTSLLRCLAGLEKNYEGSISVLGKDLRTYSQNDRTLTIGWCPAHSSCAFPYSVLEVVCMGRFPKHRGYPSQRDYAFSEEAIEQMGIHDLRTKVIDTLSSGEMRKVMIAQVLASHNPVLIFDEPDAHLDIACVFHTLSLFKDLCRKGQSFCLSLHDLHLAREYADHLLLLRGGHVLTEGEPEKVFQTKPIREGFGVEMQSVKTAQKDLLSFSPQVQTLSERIFNDK